MDIDEVQRRVPYLVGSDLAYEFGVDYFESTTITNGDSEAMRKEKEELEIMFEGKIRGPVNTTGDKIDSSGDPDLIVQHLIRKILKQVYWRVFYM
jgi:hypothetical protein